MIVYKDYVELKFLNINNELPPPDQDSFAETLISIKANCAIELYGVASVRTEIDTTCNGPVLINSTISGKLNKQ